MTMPNDPESVPPQPPSVVHQPVQSVMNSAGFSAQPTSPFINKPVRRAGRTLLIAGVFLVLLFFSPFVSCNAGSMGGITTVNGYTAFRLSLGISEHTAVSITGVLFGVFPLAGLAGALLGAWALQSSTTKRTIPQLRTFSIVVLVFAMLTSCTILMAFSQMASSQGMYRLEWGFYLSVLAAIGLVVGAFDLLKNWHRYS